MEILEMVMPIIVISILAFGMLWGFIRKLHRTLFRFVFLLLAAGGAFVLSKMFSATVSDYVFQFLKSLEIEGLSEFMNSSGEGVEIVEALCRVLAAPLLFLAFYIVLKPISWIPYKIFSAIFCVKGPRYFGRLTGALAGLLCGFVGLVVFVTPVYGYLHLVDDAVDRILPAEKIPKEMTAVMALTETPVALQAHHFVGRHLFTGLTTQTVDGVEFSLEKEVDALIVVADEASVLLKKSPEEYGIEEAETIESLAHDVGHSRILSSLLSSALSEVSNAWLNNEAAFGIKKPEMGANMQGIMDGFFVVFSTSDSQNIEADLTTFADVFRILIEEDMMLLLSGEGNTSGFVEKLVSDGVAGDLYQVLDLNPRMKPVKSAIIDTGMRVMLEQIGVSEDLQENYGEMMEDIVTTLQDAANEDGTLDKEKLNSELQIVLQENEIEVSPEVIEIVTDGFAEAVTVEDLENLTMEELVDKLIDRFAGAELPDGITLPDNLENIMPK